MLSFLVRYRVRKPCITCAYVVEENSPTVGKNYIRVRVRRGNPVETIHALWVVSGLILAEFFAVINGIISFERMLPTGIFLVGLITLFNFSYFNARGIAAQEQS